LLTTDSVALFLELVVAVRIANDDLVRPAPYPVVGRPAQESAFLSGYDNMLHETTFMMAYNVRIFFPHFI
jgi:hypothetical protein